MISEQEHRQLKQAIDARAGYEPFSPGVLIKILCKVALQYLEEPRAKKLEEKFVSKAADDVRRAVAETSE